MPVLNAGAATALLSNATGIRLDPFGSAKFLIEIQGLIAGGFQSVSGLDHQLQTESYREADVLMVSDFILYKMEEELLRGVRESGARWASAIAMDPHTGAVLAMANVPTYDPNRPAAFGTVARRNHAVTDQIEPGSVFKMISAVAALEQDVVALDDTIDTGNGYARFGGRGMHDTHGYGRISFADVLANSSNVGTAKVISEIDRGVFYRYARDLGFGQPTWIDLPGEVGGLLKRPEHWSGTTLTSMSIGYEVNATPLQILTAYCALANGGLLVQPYVVAERRDVTGRTVWQAPVDSIRRAFEPETAEALLPAGSPGWLRAQDIALQVEERQRRGQEGAGKGELDLRSLVADHGKGRHFAPGSGGRGDSNHRQQRLLQHIVALVVQQIAAVRQQNAHTLGRIERTTATDCHQQINLLLTRQRRALLAHLRGIVVEPLDRPGGDLGGLLAGRGDLGVRGVSVWHGPGRSAGARSGCRCRASSRPPTSASAGAA